MIWWTGAKGWCELANGWRSILVCIIKKLQLLPLTILDDYCRQFLELPPRVAAKIKPLPELSAEERKSFAKGLAGN
jgi:hypothetical protein